MMADYVRSWQVYTALELFVGIWHGTVAACRSSLCSSIGYNAAMQPTFHATTVLCVRRGSSDVAIAGDGQVTMQHTIAKADAVKVRKLDGFGVDRAGVLLGFAGSAAD